MKVSNPLLNELRRQRRNGLALLLVLALSMALLDYLTALTDRIDVRQAQLTMATSDLDHQITPLLHLAQVLQTVANQALQQAPTAAVVLTGQVTALHSRDKLRPAEPLTDAEMFMLQQLEPWFHQQLKSTQYLLNLSYVSERLQWFHLTGADPSFADLAQVALQQIGLLGHTQLNTNIPNLLVLDPQQQRYAVHVPVRQDKTVVGHLLLEIDLLTMVQQVRLAQPEAGLILLDKVGQVLLAIQDAQMVEKTIYDGAHQNDSVQNLSTLPIALHIQPNATQTTKAELIRFVSEILFYLLPLLVLYLYLLSRFKRQVLRPFSRFLIHVARMERGDVHGVRHVPIEWETVFKQTEQLRDRGLEKSAD